LQSRYGATRAAYSERQAEQFRQAVDLQSFRYKGGTGTQQSGYRRTSHLQLAWVLRQRLASLAYFVARELR